MPQRRTDTAFVSPSLPVVWALLQWLVRCPAPGRIDRSLAIETVFWE